MWQTSHIESGAIHVSSGCMRKKVSVQFAEVKELAAYFCIEDNTSVITVSRVAKGPRHQKVHGIPRGFQWVVLTYKYIQ